jgi:S-adenosylmethionine hydrolase
VIARIAPGTCVIDITHGIAPQNVLQGALVLADTLPYMPHGIHVAVVDPGVGGPRRPVALETADGRVLVGPDNGVLLEAAERLGGATRAVELTAEAYMLRPVSPTFHGRDLFAPVAAHLARGVALEALGPELDPACLVRVELPRSQVEPGRVQATVLAVDRFGNVRLNVGAGELAQAGIDAGAAVEVEVAGRRFAATVARTFADVRPGGIVLLEDSSRSVAVAVNRGSAARTLSTVPGQEVVVAARREDR